MQAPVFSGGFSDPVFGAQTVFRALLAAMSSPGTPRAVSIDLAPPPPLLPMAGALLCMLADADTPVFIDDTLAASTPVAAWLGFHTGAPVVSDPAQAAFAVIADSASIPPLAAFSQGTLEYPDRSTTLIVQVRSRRSTQTQFAATGPGIDGRRRFAVPGLPPGFREAWRANTELFPLGVDIVFASRNGIVGLPRTTRLAPQQGVGCT